MLCKFKVYLVLIQSIFYYEMISTIALANAAHHVTDVPFYFYGENI